jgi:hypothetical protein
MTPTAENQEQLIESRQRWLSEAHWSERKDYSELPFSAHGILLQYDITRAFCAGAWISVIVIAQAAIEATMRDIETQDYTSNAHMLFKGDEGLERIRTLRNEILHLDPPGSPSKVWTVPNGDYVACHAALEDDAKKAVRLMFRAIYMHVVK